MTTVFLFTNTVVLHFNLNIVKKHFSWLFLAFLKIQFANSICVLIFSGNSVVVYSQCRKQLNVLNPNLKCCVHAHEVCEIHAKF